MSGNNTIELNGKRYDTRTGKLLSGHHAPAKPAAKPASHSAQPVATAKSSHQLSKVKAPAKPRVARSIDGIRPASPGRKPTASRKTNHAARRNTQRSQTLMRGNAIQKPASPIAVSAPSRDIIGSTAPLYGVDPARLKRAEHAHLDKRISRFALPVITSEAAPAKPTPAATPPTEPPQPTLVVAPPPVSTLEQAVRNADSHTQQKAKAPSRLAHHRVAKKLGVKPRSVATTAAVLLFVSLGSLAVYTNMPRIRTQIAGSKAGISASLPASVPSGFNLSSNIDHSNGEVVLTYGSQADSGRNFTITQTESFWTSESLRENFLSALDTDYQTVQENGKTVYVYGQNATWVDGGIWYRVEAANAQLSSQQLTQLTRSL
jgi:hypothetical protein